MLWGRDDDAFPSFVEVTAANASALYLILGARGRRLMKIKLWFVKQQNLGRLAHSKRFQHMKAPKHIQNQNWLWTNVLYRPINRLQA